MGRQVGVDMAQAWFPAEMGRRALPVHWGGGGAAAAAVTERRQLLQTGLEGSGESYSKRESRR